MCAEVARCSGYRFGIDVMKAMGPSPDERNSTDIPAAAARLLFVLSML